MRRRSATASKHAKEWRCFSLSQKFVMRRGNGTLPTPANLSVTKLCRDALVRTGAVITRHDVPTSSSAPRYAMSTAFAALFNPSLTGAPLKRQSPGGRRNTSQRRLARIQIITKGAAHSKADYGDVSQWRDTQACCGPSAPS